MRWFEVRNLWVDTEAALTGRDTSRYDSVGYFDGAEQHDATWREVARFSPGTTAADDADRRNREEETNAQLAEHGFALAIEKGPEDSTTIGLKDATGAWASTYPTDGMAAESMGIAWRVLHHRSERALVFDALLVRYLLIGSEFHV